MYRKGYGLFEQAKKKPHEWSFFASANAGKDFRSRV